MALSITVALQGLAGAGVFASRAFLPLFIVALVARFPELVSWAPLVPEQPVALSDRMGWLVADWCLITLGLLAVAEIRFDKSPEIRELLSGVDPWVKGAVAFTATFGLLDGEAASLLDQLASSAALLIPRGGVALVLGASLAVGVAVVFAARLRGRMLEHVAAADPDGGLGLMRFTSMVEDFWAAGGILLVLLAPAVAAVLALLLLAVVAWADRRLERRAEARRRPCVSCGELLRAESAACAQCGTPREPDETPSSRAWPDRWLPAAEPAADRALQLLAQGRCPACAERRDPRSLLSNQTHGCRWPAVTDQAGGLGVDWTTHLDAHLGRRAAHLAAFAFLLGLLPVVGAIAALVLGRLRIAVPYRRYLTFGGRLGSRWLARAMTVLLVLLSGVPVVSAIAAPGLVLVQLVAYRRAFRRAVRG